MWSSVCQQLCTCWINNLPSVLLTSLVCFLQAMLPFAQSLVLHARTVLGAAMKLRMLMKHVYVCKNAYETYVCLQVSIFPAACTIDMSQSRLSFYVICTACWASSSQLRLLSSATSSLNHLSYYNII